MELAHLIETVLLIFLLLGDFSILGRSVCPSHQFWFDITGKCEPCSLICDPPGVHVNDCPRLCGAYTTTTTSTTKTTTTTESTTTTATSMTTISNQKENSEIITIIIISFISFLFLNVLVCCFCYKKRRTIKTHWPFKYCFNRHEYKTTCNAVPVSTDQEARNAEDENQPLNVNDDDDHTAEEHELDDVNVENQVNDNTQTENQPQNRNNG